MEEVIEGFRGQRIASDLCVSQAAEPVRQLATGVVVLKLLRKPYLLAYQFLSQIGALDGTPSHTHYPSPSTPSAPRSWLLPPPLMGMLGKLARWSQLWCYFYYQMLLNAKNFTTSCFCSRSVYSVTAIILSMRRMLSNACNVLQALYLNLYSTLLTERLPVQTLQIYFPCTYHPFKI